MLKKIKNNKPNKRKFIYPKEYESHNIEENSYMKIKQKKNDG